MKIAVTGGSGFIGSHVVDHCKAAGHDVVVIDHRVKPHCDDVAFEDVDLTDFASVLSATKGCGAIFHLAAVSNVNYAFEHPVYTVDLNILSTAKVLEAARVNGVKRVVFASTVWVYSGATEEQVDEDTPFSISGAGHIYTSSKIAAEYLFHDYAKLYKQEFTILRYGIPYGPRMRDELLIPIFIRKALKGEPLTIAGDGAQYRNFVHRRPGAQTFWPWTPRPPTAPTTRKDRITIKEVAEAVRRSGTRSRHPARPGTTAEGVGTRPRGAGLDPFRGFDEGMRRTIAWYRTNCLSDRHAGLPLTHVFPATAKTRPGFSVRIGGPAARGHTVHVVTPGGRGRPMSSCSTACA